MSHATGRRTVDFDLSGLVRLRLDDAEGRHVQAVRRQLGLEAVAAAGTADLTVRFVDAVPRGGSLRLLGTDAAWDDTAFFALRGDQPGAGLVQLPLDELGAGLTVHCERTIRDVPQLVPLVNVTCISKGVLPLHASAAELDGTGIAAAGWSKGGKTEALLALVSAGARAIADEWCYVEPDSRRAHGVPSPVRITDAHLSELPELRPLLSPSTRLRIAAAGLAARGYAGIPSRAWRRAGPLSWIHRFAPMVEGLRHTDVPATQLLGDRLALSGRLDRLVLLVAAEGDETRARAIDAEQVAERMVFAHQHHRLGLLALHDQFRFARPAAAAEAIERLEERERALLRRALAGLPATLVEHPHPVKIAALRRVLLNELRRDR